MHTESPRRRLGSLALLLLATAVVVGFFLRLWISYRSLGSNDWEAWAHFGYWIKRWGLFEMYKVDPRLNHPPLMALWSAAARDWADRFGWSFPSLFRLPMLLADAGVCALLGLIWARRRGATAGWGAAAAYAWCAPAILIGAYHCNTDNLCAAFALLAAYCIAERRSFGGAGLALAAAINVKLIPILLIPPLLAQARDWKEARRFIAGLAVGALPFVPALIAAGPAFYRNALAYNPLVDRWGIPLWLEAITYWHYWRWWPEQRLWPFDALDWWHDHAKSFILAGAFAFGAVAFAVQKWRPGRAWSAYEAVAVTFSLFLLLTGGFGVQYLVYAAPALFAVSRRAGWAYGLWAGLFLAFIYTHWWTGGRPWASSFGGPAQMPAPLFGILAWYTLLMFVVRTLLKPRWTRLDGKPA